MSLAAETLARRSPQLVATVGTIAVPGGAANVIPGETVLSLDVRHPLDVQQCRSARAPTSSDSRSKSPRRRGLALQWQPTMDHRAVACSPDADLGCWRQSVRAVQKRSLALVSGAGHDAVIIAALTPVAMLFVRCRDGLSHHPDEYRLAAPT